MSTYKQLKLLPTFQDKGENHDQCFHLGIGPDSLSMADSGRLGIQQMPLRHKMDLVKKQHFISYQASETWLLVDYQMHPFQETIGPFSVI